MLKSSATNKLYVCLVLILALGILTPYSSHYNVNASSIKENNMDGEVYADLIYDISTLTDCAAEFAYNIKTSGQTINLSGQLKYNGNIYDISLIGDLYKAHFEYFGDILVSKLDIDNELFEVVNFEIELESQEYVTSNKNKKYLGKPIIKLVLISKENNEIIVFESPIYDKKINNIVQQSTILDANDELHGFFERYITWFMRFSKKDNIEEINTLPAAS